MAAAGSSVTRRALIAATPKLDACASRVTSLGPGHSMNMTMATSPDAASGDGVQTQLDAALAVWVTPGDPKIAVMVLALTSEQTSVGA
ncbi:MAG: hypothetical protein JOZ28_03260 [Candidatus Eremiobacteraeota bacterium]|nr:hypothetical protein [Candidatus Eremiobacteraeota bacterium]